MTLIIIQKFIFHCLNLKVCFWTVHFEIAEAGPRPRSRPGVVTNLRNLTDVSWPLLVPLTQSTPYWSYLFTLLSTLTLWKIHAGLNRDQRRLFRRQAILRQDGGRRTEKRQLGPPRIPQPSAPTIQTFLSHRFLGLHTSKIWGLSQKKMYIEFFARNHMVVTPLGEKSDFWNILLGDFKDTAPQS